MNHHLSMPSPRNASSASVAPQVLTGGSPGCREEASPACPAIAPLTPPARRAFRRGPVSPFVLPAMLAALLLGTALLGPSAASAQSFRTPGSAEEKARRNLWVASQHLRYKGVAHWERLARLRYFVDIWRPGMRREEATELMARWDADWARSRAPYEDYLARATRADAALLGLIAVAKSVAAAGGPEGEVAGTAVEETVKFLVMLHKEERDKNTKNLTQAASTSLNQVLQIANDGWAREVYDKLFEKAFASDGSATEAGHTFDLLFSAEGSRSIYSTTPQLLEDPELKPYEILDKLVDAEGNLTTRLDELKGDLQAELHATLDAVNQSSRAELALLGKFNERIAILEAQIEALIAQGAEQRAIEEARRALALEIEKRRKEAEDRKAAYQAQIDTASANVYLISQITRIFSPELADKVATVGNSAITIADAAFKLHDALTKSNITDVLTSAGGAMLTGNVIGAVLAAVTVFADTGPKPEEMILDGIRTIQTQVEDLRVAMHSRFDRIDMGLEAIYTAMGEHFGSIDTKLDSIHVDVKAVQEALLGAQADVLRFERNLYAILSDTQRQDLTARTAMALGLARRIPGYQLPFGDYVEHEAFFRNWGTTFASTSLIAVGPPARRLGDEDVAEEWTAWPLDANVGYLAQMAAAWGVPGPASPRSPNLRDWAVASRAYADLTLEWPEHARRFTTAGFDALIETGMRIRSDLRAFARAGGGANHALYTSAGQNVLVKAHALTARLAQIESEYLETAGIAVDVWANEDQDVPGGEQPQSGGDQARDCRTVPTRSPVPPTADLAPRALLLAQHLGLGDARLCYRAAWTNIRTGGEDGGGDGDRVQRVVGDLQVTVFSRFDPVKDGEPVAVLERQAVRGGLVICAQRLDDNGNPITPCDPRGWDAWLQAGLRWDQGLGQALAAAPATDPGKLAGLRALVEADLGRHQRLLASRIVADLETGRLRGLADALTGARGLLEGYVVAGLPQALERDGRLRALLHGSSGIPADIRAALLPLYQQAAAERASADPILTVEHWTIDRTEEANRIVGEHLTAIDEGKNPQQHEVLESTLMWLDVTRWLTHGGAPRDPVVVIERRPEDRVQPPARDTRAPKLRTGVARRQDLTAVRRRGLRATVRCSEACRVSARLIMDRRTARRLRLGRRAVLVGQASGRRTAVRSHALRVRLTPRAGRAVRRARSLRLTLRITATDAAGNRATQAVRVSIRR